MPRRMLLEDILEEMGNQDEEWGPQRDHDDGMWLKILIEELGEACEDSLKCNLPGQRCELVQATAVLCQWIEAVDRRMEVKDAETNAS